MNKLLIFVIGILIIAGVYFAFVKNNTPNEPASNNTEKIPQPPTLPE